MPDDNKPAPPSITLPKDPLDTDFVFGLAGIIVKWVDDISPNMDPQTKIAALKIAAEMNSLKMQATIYGMTMQHLLSTLPPKK